MLTSCIAAIVAAWLLWLVDIYYCTPLRQTREVVGLPWAFLLELHGWYIFSLRPSLLSPLPRLLSLPHPLQNRTQIQFMSS